MECLHRQILLEYSKGRHSGIWTYAKAFPKLAAYPDMVSWLENSNDRLSDIELWGVEKPVYGFADLLEWLENNGIGKNQKEKEKWKGKGKEKEKEEKEKEKKKNKGKSREVTGGRKEKNKNV